MLPVAGIHRPGLEHVGHQFGTQQYYIGNPITKTSLSSFGMSYVIKAGFCANINFIRLI